MFSLLLSATYAEESVFAWDDYIASLAADHLWNWILSNCDVVYDDDNKFSHALLSHYYQEHMCITLNIEEKHDEFVAECNELGTTFTLASVHDLLSRIRESEGEIKSYWYQEYMDDEFTSSAVLCAINGLPY